ncbi:hypothetical protein DFAR_3460024 [Desulfarculales bacterium]
MPWTRDDSRFTLLVEQAAMTLVREMPVLAAARITRVSDTRLWRVVQFYVAQAMSKMDLGGSRPWLWTKPPPSGATTTPPCSST